MRTIKFPNMFQSNSTNVWRADEYHEATQQAIETLLLSERGELFGDPFFGIMLKHYMFDQNAMKIRDCIIDTIYVQLATFIPQIKVDRNDIDIYTDDEKGKLYVKFKATCLLDFKIDTYRLVLYENDAE